MNRKGIFSALAAAIFGILIVGSSASAQGRHGGVGGGRPGAMANRLNLTDAQREQIKKNQEQFRTQHAQEFADIKALEEKAREYAKNGDKTNAQATREQIKAKMEPLRQQMQNNMDAVLTPEQKAEAAKMKAEMKEKMGERRKERREKRNG